MRSRNVNLLQVTSEEAKDFFLKEENYATLDLPPYFTFKKMLKNINDYLKYKDFSQNKKKASDCSDVNYIIYNNKDGKYAWRPLQLIHPVLYVNLVNIITKDWDLICNRFEDFRNNKNIKCYSIPQVPTGGKKQKENQILYWWKKIEQVSIELSLEYDYIFETDIADCYSSIYTHSIPWAIHGKDKAKANKNSKDLVGNQIDAQIRNMQYGQTNGIPQGSVLMDFIAEIVLGYSDILFLDKLESKNINKKDYKITRYRDDYKIYVNDTELGKNILKYLTEVLIELNFKLNPGKTKYSQNIIKSSIKEDKLAWIKNIKAFQNIQQELLIIHEHSSLYPNSGSVTKALTILYKRIKDKKESFYKKKSLIAILADIAYRNPRAYPVCIAIISMILSDIDNDERKKIVKAIYQKIKRLPNTGYIEIWLQRICLSDVYGFEYKEKLCKVVNGKGVDLWNSEWLTDSKLKFFLNPKNIINEKKYKSISPTIPYNEVALFPERYF